MDVTFVIHKEANKQGFLQHINSVDPAIRFTVEDNKEDGSIPFLDTIVKPEVDGSLSITVYQENPHIQTSIYSGTVTITSQPSLVSSKPFPTGLPPCAVILSCFKKKRSTSGKLSPNATTPNGLWTRWRKGLTSLPDRLMMGAATMPKLPTKECKVRGHIVIPYTQGLCESIKRICGRYGIQTHFKGGTTIKNLLVSPKDKDPMVNQSSAIYWYQCGDLGCDDEYIGETSRTFGERYKEHLKAPSAIHHHSTITGHTTNHKQLPNNREGGAQFS